jgi:2-dehydro-3-deoxyphosphogluconate aldolase/(4S)-4-hydroxy-2-oxoglutarate aldolase
MSEAFSDFYARLHKTGLVPIVRISSEQSVCQLADVLEKHGFDALIIRYEGQVSSSVVQATAKAYPHMLVGVSEIVNIEQLQEVAAAGATFVTVPNYTQAICECGLKLKVPVISVTVDEGGIFHSNKMGLSVTGIMPAGHAPTLPTAELFGAAFKGSRYMPMDGVTAEEVPVYLASPFIEAIGVVEWMVAPEALAAGDFAAIDKDISAAQKILAACKA